MCGSVSVRVASPPIRTVTSALVAATSEPDARVRESAANTLGRLPLQGIPARDVGIRLREIARRDPNLIVRGAALPAHNRLEKNAAIPLAKQLMTAEGRHNLIRA